MCQCCKNVYYNILYYCFNLPILLDENNNDTYNDQINKNLISNNNFIASDELLAFQTRYTDVDLYNDHKIFINPMIIKR